MQKPPLNRLVLTAAAFLLLSVHPAIAALLKCPECTNIVSEAAAACPKCGAPIALIKQAALSAQRTNDAARKDRRNCAVLLQSDTATGFGVAVEQDGKRFLIFDQRLIETAQSLTICPTITNTPINYRNLELASEGTLARLTAESTNILYLHLAPATEGDTDRALSLYVLTNGETAINVDREHIDNSAHLLCICDPHTNLLAIAQPGTALAPSATPAATQWIPALPGDFRKQTRLLAETQARLASPRPPDRASLPKLKTELESTKWLTSPLHARALALIRTIDTRSQ